MSTIVHEKGRRRDLRMPYGELLLRCGVSVSTLMSLLVELHNVYAKQE